jgi:hypothetical protein
MYGGGHLVHCESLLHKHSSLVEVFVIREDLIRVC